VTLNRRSWRWRSIALGVIAVAAIMTGCGGGASEDGRAAREYHAGGGISAVIPAGWHKVALKKLPGADVPLEIASFHLRGAVTDICNPGRRITDQIPAGDALVQLLDDTNGFRHRPAVRQEFPPLPRPFHLGQPQGHECGEGYNVFFRRGGRAFQLRIWTALRRGARPWLLRPPSRVVRHQIEAIVDSLRIQSGPRAASSSSNPIPPHFTKCPAHHARQPPGAGSWGGSVAGISCYRAARVIPRVERYPPRRAAPIRTSDPSSYRRGGFYCSAFPLVAGGGGWHVLCERADKWISFFFTP
jgi:hypothetical protein